MWLGIPFNLHDECKFSNGQNMEVLGSIDSEQPTTGARFHRCSPLTPPFLISALQDPWIPVESGGFSIVGRPSSSRDCKQLSG